MSLMYVGKFNGRRLYTGVRLDYRLRLWAPTSVLYAISAVAELVSISDVMLWTKPATYQLLSTR